MKLFAALLCSLAILAAPAAARIERNPAVPRMFQKANPCPATGKTSGACPGWQKDHVMPLCAGGADAPENMHWLSIADHKAKTRRDVRECHHEQRRR